MLVKEVTTQDRNETSEPWSHAGSDNCTAIVWSDRTNGKPAQATPVEGD